MKVLNSGPPATIELRLVPKRNFDAVLIEAASGVASLNTSCDLARTGVVAGRAYVCQAEITGKPSEAAMTLNVIARRTIPGGAVPVMEVHNLSIKNTAFAVSQKHASALTSRCRRRGVRCEQVAAPRIGAPARRAAAFALYSLLIAVSKPMVAVQCARYGVMSASAMPSAHMTAIYRSKEFFMIAQIRRYCRLWHQKLVMPSCAALLGMVGTLATAAMARPPHVSRLRLYVMDCGTIVAMDPALYGLKAEEIHGDTGVRYALLS